MDEVNDSTSLNSSSLTSTSPRTSSWKRIEKKWNQVQVGHQGSYSVERLELLDHYCNNTSLVRVVLLLLWNVCLYNRHPPGGLRTGCSGFDSTGNLCVDRSNFTAKRIVSSRSYDYWLPRAVHVAARLYNDGDFRTYFVNGPGVFVNGSALAQHHKRLLNSFFVHLALIGVYPLCRVLYDLIPHLYRGVVVFIIPLWKFAAKRFAVRMVHELEDFVPELVAFSVDFFSALFVSVCMSTSGSFHLTGLFITVDILFALVKFRTLHKDEKVIRQLLQDRRHMISSQLTKSESFGLLPMILEVVRNPKSYGVTSFDRVRLWASPPHLVPDTLYERLQTMGKSCLFGGNQADLMRVSSFIQVPTTMFLTWKFRQISVIPAPLTIVPRTAQLPPNLRKESSVRPTDPSKYLVLHGLQLLFNCEYLVLVEYIECVVPFVFVVYKSVLERLPNAVYFPGGSGNWGIPAVTNLLVFGVLEVGSLVLLHVFLQRKFGFSSLYQLAFVLETQASAIQAHLFPVTIFLLQYQLAHLGVDFTFRFEWLRDKIE